MVKDFPIGGVFTPETDYVDQLPLNTEERKNLKKTTAQSLNSLQKELGGNYHTLKIKGKVKTFDSGYGLRVRDENGNKIGTIYKGEEVRILERKKGVVIENGQKKNFVKVDVYNERGRIDKNRSGWVAEDFIEIDSTSIDNQIQNLEEKVKRDTVVKPKEATEQKGRTKSVVKPKEGAELDTQKGVIVKPKEMERKGKVEGAVVKPKNVVDTVEKPAEKKPEPTTTVEFTPDEQELLAAGTHSILNGKVVHNSEISKIREEAKKKAETDKAAEEAKKKAETDKAAEEAKKKAETDKAAEEAKKKAETDKAAEEAKKKAETDKAAEEAKKKAETDKAAEEAKKKAETDKAAEEAKKKAETDKAAEEAKKKAETDKAAEEAKKKAETDKAAEEAKKKAETDKAAEEAKKKAETDKAAEEAKKKAETDKAAEEAKKKAETDKAAEEAKKATEKREKQEKLLKYGGSFKALVPDDDIDGIYKYINDLATNQYCTFEEIMDLNDTDLYFLSPGDILTIPIHKDVWNASNLYGEEGEVEAPEHIIEYNPLRQVKWNRYPAGKDAKKLANWIAKMYNGDTSLIFDKENARMYIMKDNEIVYSSAFLYGANDATDIMTQEAYNVNPDNNAPKKHKITPAGQFPVKMNTDDHKLGVNGVSFGYLSENEAEGTIHKPYLDIPSENRLQRLKSTTPDDNNVSYGCLNIPNEAVKEIEKYFQDGKTFAYVMPNMLPIEEYFPLDYVPKDQIIAHSDSN